MNRRFWAAKRVLVTGHTGFKGAWLTLWLQHLGAEVTGLALPPSDPKAAFSAMAPWPGLDSRMVDLRDAAAVRGVVETARPEVIFHLGAQALVRRGYQEPLDTYAVNVLGTAHLLDAARGSSSTKVVVVASSDKVYSNPGDGHPFREDDPLGGHDPYSSSKACVELVTRAWRESFLAERNVAVATVRAGNVLGGGDRGADRLLPDAQRSLEAGEALRLRYPMAIRPWQFVLDPLAGYLALAEKLWADPSSGPLAVNFGPDSRACRRTQDIVESAFKLFGEGSWHPVGGAHPREALLLLLDPGLAAAALGWRCRVDLDLALEWTVEWWRQEAAAGNLRSLALDQTVAYESMGGR